MVVIGVGVGGVGACGAETGVASWVFPPPFFIFFLFFFFLSVFVILAHSAAASSPGRDGSCGSDTHAHRAALAAHMLAAVWLLEARISFHECVENASGASDRRNGAPLGLHPVLQAAERLVLRCVTRANTLFLSFPFSFCLFLSFFLLCEFSSLCLRHFGDLVRGCDAEFGGLLIFFS